MTQWTFEALYCGNLNYDILQTSATKMATACPSGELVPTYQTTMCQNSDDCNAKITQHYIMILQHPVALYRSGFFVYFPCLRAALVAVPSFLY
jgi:hypothetical protein